MDIQELNSEFLHQQINMDPVSSFNYFQEHVSQSNLIIFASFLGYESYSKNDTSNETNRSQREGYQKRYGAKKSNCRGW